MTGPTPRRKLDEDLRELLATRLSRDHPVRVIIRAIDRDVESVRDFVRDIGGQETGVASRFGMIGFEVSLGMLERIASEDYVEAISLDHPMQIAIAR